MCDVFVPVHYTIVCCCVHAALDLTECYSLQERIAISSIDCLVQSCATYKTLCEYINFIEASSCFNAEVVQHPCRLWMIVVYALAQPTTTGPDLLHCRIESWFLSGAEHDRILNALNRAELAAGCANFFGFLCTLHQKT